nr:deoxyribodipyrimidine photo-lyase [Flavobacterium piscinae]
MKNNLASKNISLLIFHDLPENVIPRLVEEHHISTIFLQKEWTQEEVNVNVNVKNNINRNFKNQISRVEFVETYNQFLFHPSDIPYADFQKYRKFLPNFVRSAKKKVRFDLV